MNTKPCGVSNLVNTDETDTDHRLGGTDGTEMVITQTSTTARSVFVAIGVIKQ